MLTIFYYVILTIFYLFISSLMKQAFYKINFHLPFSMQEKVEYILDVTRKQYLCKLLKHLSFFFQACIYLISFRNMRIFQEVKIILDIGPLMRFIFT